MDWDSAERDRPSSVDRSAAVLRRIAAEQVVAPTENRGLLSDEIALVPLSE